MDLQSLFNTVSSHLLTQNAKSVDHEFESDSGSAGCAYRGENGLQCAAGCLIPDEAYNFDMEGETALSVFKGYSSKLPKDIWNWPNIELIGKLQEIHDHTQVSDWPRRLTKLAKEYDLVFIHPQSQGTNHQP